MWAPTLVYNITASNIGISFTDFFSYFQLAKPGNGTDQLAPVIRRVDKTDERCLQEWAFDFSGGIILSLDK